jgi:uncharacterized protein (DUF2336 family)
VIVRRFLLWCRTATARQRAEAVATLAHAYLHGELSPEDRGEAETALTAMLDDASPLVRRALAEAVADEAAPRHLVVALAQDQSDIAALVLARSPVLADPDLVDCAALGDGLVQTAIALRPRVSVAVCAALAEVAEPEALAALAGNPAAAIAPSSLSRMIERHGGHGPLREALLARSDLPLDLRQAIVGALAASLSAFVAERGWLPVERVERVSRESCERTSLALSGRRCPAEVQRLVRHLREAGQLTPALILRGLLSRAGAFVEAALAELSGLPLARTAGLLREPGGFAALCRRAALPASLHPALLAARAAIGPWPPETADVRLCRAAVSTVLAACDALPPEEAGRLTALLRRLEAEAAREEAGAAAAALAADAALATVLEQVPLALLELHRPAALAAA